MGNPPLVGQGGPCRADRRMAGFFVRGSVVSLESLRGITAGKGH